MSEVVSVTGIAAGGDGVGRLADGRAVFVPRTVPGDRVELRAGVSVRRHFARGEVARVLDAGPARVGPACPHYLQDRCGGCQLQHLGYDAQIQAKRAIVGDALRRIGKLDVENPECVEAVDEWRYRTKISLAAAPRRSAEASSAIGFHPYDQPGRVFGLLDCHIASFALMDFWREVKEQVALLPHTLTRLTLRLDRDGGRHVVAESSGAPWTDAQGLRGALSNPDSVTCWWQPPDGTARVLAGGTGVPATAFEQVNPEMAVLVRAWVVEQLGDVAERVAWDLYGGMGDMARLLAERGANVVSVDSDEAAIAWARTRAPDVRFIAGRAEDVVGTLPEPSIVVVNPPRGGLHWTVTLRLQERPVPRVAYVSCDPATLARDLQRLAVRYRIAAVRAFDLFPQTAHVETVAILEGVA